MRIAIVEDQAEDQTSLSVFIAEDAERRGWVNEIEVFESGEAFLSAAGTFDIFPTSEHGGIPRSPS